ncbi:hyaluronidase-3 [Ornithorhynchus anatinus]|uniref:hyaluronidase-3 n=1 Tax=Ornithorhynchus anatinus TaxID=9258 RepID=UPI0010A7A4D2|nr:hyaluronidase-3 [Ornithorhynchus anatinus]
MAGRPGLALWAWVVLCVANGRETSGTPHRPFMVVWNVPSAQCQTRFGTPLPLASFGILSNRAQRFRGQNVSIFYKNQFGLYPYLAPSGSQQNGGIPQAAPLNRHLARAARQICQLLRGDFEGLAVVDWEEWRPLWSRNWGPKRIYREASLAWLQQKCPWLSPSQRLRVAQASFEQAARAFMEDTLRLGRALRPRGLWGFYSFPRCFNPWQAGRNYTGHCHPTDRPRNDRLRWLWEASSALYPSIYLPPGLPAAQRQRYVGHRLGEAFRVAQFGRPSPLPVLAYARLSHHSSGRFLSQDDLVQTIGVSVALGAAGVVVWGDLSFSSSAEQCGRLRDYVMGTLGPYALNVTRAARACSRQLCHAHGRCARQEPGHLGTFLHLQPGAESASLGGKENWASFHCHCYHGWMGKACEMPIRGPE